MHSKPCSTSRYSESDQRECAGFDVIAEFAGAVHESLKLRFLTPLLDCVLAVPWGEREKAPRIRRILDKVA